MANAMIFQHPKVQKITANLEELGWDHHDVGVLLLGLLEGFDAINETVIMLAQVEKISNAPNKDKMEAYANIQKSIDTNIEKIVQDMKTVGIHDAEEIFEEGMIEEAKKLDDLDAG